MKDLNHFLGSGVKAAFTDTSVDFQRLDMAFGLTELQSDHLRSLNFDPERVAHIHQIHSNRVLDIDEAYIEDGLIVDADAVVTADPAVVLTIRTADCVPIFLYDQRARAIGLVHAGWRGAADDIIGNAVLAMKKVCHASPENIKAVLGPSIHKCCYQVGQEFCAIFPEYVMPQEGNWFLDLQAACRKKLLEQGILGAQILDVEECTCCCEKFFSYRRQKDQAGRHLSVMQMV